MFPLFAGYHLFTLVYNGGWIEFIVADLRKKCDYGSDLSVHWKVPRNMFFVRGICTSLLVTETDITVSHDKCVRALRDSVTYLICW